MEFIRIYVSMVSLTVYAMNYVVYYIILCPLGWSVTSFYLILTVILILLVLFASPFHHEIYWLIDERNSISKWMMGYSLRYSFPFVNWITLFYLHSLFSSSISEAKRRGRNWLKRKEVNYSHESNENQFYEWMQCCWRQHEMNYIKWFETWRHAAYERK